MSLANTFSIGAITGRIEITCKKFIRIIEIIIELIKSNLAHSEDVLINGFDNFWVKKIGNDEFRNSAGGMDIIG